MPGSKEAQLFNWNALEAMAAFAWLGSFVSPPNVIVFTLLRVMRMAFVATKGKSRSVEPDVAVVLGVVCYLNHAVRGF